MSKHQTAISKNVANKKIIVEREFDAPLEDVWQAWTNSEMLDKWWAPKPWKAKTKSMDFKEGGIWLYSMVGPDGTESFCRADFTAVEQNKRYAGDDAFCDRNGDINHDIPGMHWDCTFTATPTGTKVQVELTFTSEDDMKKIIEMGFEEGFTSAHGNLDELLGK